MLIKEKICQWERWNSHIGRSLCGYGDVNEKPVILRRGGGDDFL